MKVAIMQPYFFPYIGYFQLLGAVDEFVIYDNIQYTKKGWINRNRILANGQARYITLPIKKDSDYLDVYQRHLADDWKKQRKRMLNRIQDAYRKAPQFAQAFPVVEACLLFDNPGLFEFLLNSLKLVNQYIGIETPLIVSSTVEIDHSLRGEQKVIALCKARSADEYINPIGGIELYSKDRFSSDSIRLSFLRSSLSPYSQTVREFVPALSVIDVVMHNSRSQINEMLSDYTLE